MSGIDDRRVALVAALRRGFVTGLAVVVPVLITAIVLAIAFNTIYNYLDLFSDALLPVSPRLYVPGVGVIPRETLVELATPVVLLLVILTAGLVVDETRFGERALLAFDSVIEAVPGVGTVYESFREMSDVMLESDARNFREVVLVEFPTEGVYTLAFVTADTPDAIQKPAGRTDMRTLFLPLAPNPVMGGHVIYVPADRVTPVDISVEEGIRAVVTSGVAVGDHGDSATGLTAEQLRDLAGTDGERTTPVHRADRPPAGGVDRDPADREATRHPPADLAGGEDGAESGADNTDGDEPHES